MNDHPIGQIGEFVLRGNQLFAKPAELRSLGLYIPQSVSGSEGDLVALSGLTGFNTRIEHSTQTLYVTADDQWLIPTAVGQQVSTAPLILESGTGATLNYDLVGTLANGQKSASGSADLRIFSRLGVLSSGMIYFADRRPAGSKRGRFTAVRLDSTYVFSDPSSMRRYRVGDFISGALPWTRPVRIGGAQVSSDFSMRPDLITFPVPSISGSASVPSTLDLLVNGSHVISESINPGPFQVSQVPVITGGGIVTTTVTDALGRQIVTQLPFYASTALLAPKLQTYSAEIGFVRRNWGIVSNDYGAPVAAITYRRGLSSHVTLEGHAEHTKGLAMGGVGVALNLSDLAEAEFAVAGSTQPGRAGAQLSVALQRVTPHYSVGASLVSDSRGFRDIAAANGDPVSTLRLNVNASVSLQAFGSLGIAYTQLDREGAGTPSSGTPPPAIEASTDSLPLDAGQHSKLLTASYSKQLGPVGLYATAFRDFTASKYTTVLVGLTMPLGNRITASVSGQAVGKTQSGQVAVDRSASVPGEWGFRAFGSGQRDNSRDGAPAKTTGHEFGQVTYKSGFGQAYAGLDRAGRQMTFQGEFVGAVSMLDGAVFASNRIDDSFAIVDTGVGGIRVRQENRDVGQTDSAGRLLVSDLRSFDTNRLSIEPLDAPMDADVPVVSRDVRPQDRSGVVVRLSVKVQHGALVQIVDVAGKPLPVGSIAKLASTGVEEPVGYDGEAYLTNVESHNEVVVEQIGGGRCSAIFDYRITPGEIPRIGPIPCRKMVR